MSLVIDVTWGNFRGFLRENGTFFYLEDSSKFVLVKPVNNYFLRSFILKDNSEKDLLFKENELNSRGAMPVVKFNFNDKKVVKNNELIENDFVNQDSNEVSDVDVDLEEEDIEVDV